MSSTGILQAVRTVKVGTQVSGQVSGIYVDFNDRVTQGQLVARIDPTLLEQAVRSAAAAVARAAADASRKSAAIALERAERNLGYTEIRSPIDGVVIDRNVDVGL